MTAEREASQEGGPPDPDTLRQVAEAIAAGSAVVCYARCWECQFGQHYEPPEWHTWADIEDVEHASATGQPDPSTFRCGCPCAKVDG